MPRKPKLEKKTITVVVNGTPVTVMLHPPTATRRSWYAYWPGLVSSKSTGQNRFEDAVVVAENMVKNGRRAEVRDTVVSDEEFEHIQRLHFGRKTDPRERARAEKSLTVCLEAIRAFKSISSLDQVTRATADDCAIFQRTAVTLPKNWRQKYPKGRKPEEVDKISPNTVLKWSRALQAAFERANRNAGKKCVRGVVPETKLLAANPWNQFDWIEGRPRPVRQFDAAEINSVLDYLETRWAGVSVASLMAKMFLWSCCRQQEVATLRWASLRRIEDEIHFEILGKWGIERWFRIPLGLYQQLKDIHTASAYVFGAYNAQLRQFHEKTDRPDNARKVSEDFEPKRLGDWFADRMEDWSANLAKGHAYIHVFRKTSLQYVRSGEDINRQVACDARVSEAVMMTSYVKETDEQRRQASNRTFARILASLPEDLSRRCGHVELRQENVEERLLQAVEKKDWCLAAELTALLKRRQFSPTG